MVAKRRRLPRLADVQHLFFFLQLIFWLVIDREIVLAIQR